MIFVEVGWRSAEKSPMVHPDRVYRSRLLLRHIGEAASHRVQVQSKGQISPQFDEGLSYLQSVRFFRPECAHDKKAGSFNRS